MNMHTSFALTHTHMDTNAQAHTIIRTSKHLCQYIQTCVNTHAFTCTHAFMHTCSRARAHTHTHTCTRAQALTNLLTRVREC